MKHSIGLFVLTAVLALGACGGGEEGAGGLTEDESRQLNEAAEMLDASPDTLPLNEGTNLQNGAEAAQTGELPVVDESATRPQ